MSVYIKHYLWGRAEFKTAINCIMVDFGSLLLILPPPPPCLLSPNLTTTAPNHPAASPSPPLRDVGSKTSIGSLRSEDAATSTPPLSKGMWVHHHSTEELGWWRQMKMMARQMTRKMRQSQHCCNYLTSKEATSSAPPLSKGMWAAYHHSMEELGR